MAANNPAAAQQVKLEVKVEEYFQEKLGSEDFTIPGNPTRGAVDLENTMFSRNPISPRQSLGFSDRGGSKCVPVDQELGLYNKVAANRIVLKHAVDDPTYNEFRDNVRMRDEFKVIS